MRDRLEQIIQSDPVLMPLLIFLRSMALPEWRLVSGCLYQTVWNVLTGRPRGTGIQDYDVIYYDAGDLSWDAEDAVIQRAAGYDLPPQIRNQARVHLWYEAHFGLPYPPLRSADEALSRYPAAVQAVGVRLESDGRIDIAAPFDLGDLFGMIMRRTGDKTVFAVKLARARAVWPEIVSLDEP